MRFLGVFSISRMSQNRVYHQYVCGCKTKARNAVAVVNLAIERRVFYPSVLGKIATVLYVVTGAVTLFFNYLNQQSIVVDLAVYMALAFTVASGLHYIVHAARMINGR